MIPPFRAIFEGVIFEGVVEEIVTKIGTEYFSKHVPEYCGVISVRPTTRATLSRIEAEASPLLLPAELRAKVEKIPFYELRTRFLELPHGPQYLLYCDRGIMSRLHASHLRDAGHEQVAVFRPPQASV